MSPDALEQRCWNHEVLNVPDRPPRKVKLKVKRQLQSAVYSRSQREAEEKRDLFVLRCEREGYHQASEALILDRGR